MEMFIVEGLKEDERMVLGDMFIIMVMFMMENGLMGNNKVKVFINIIMMMFMRDSGYKVLKKVLV